ncbi:MAG: cell surface protein SprA, partial [Chitinophagaceae bacterium]|nr:cell surface protein SprA [Chitinophagaceae bacterium]
MQTLLKHTILFCLWFGLTFIGLVGLGAGRGAFSLTQVEIPLADTPSVKKDTLRSPIEDRTQNKVAETTPKRFDLDDPKNIKTDIDYNPDEQVYSISERIGNAYYRSPSYMSFDEFLNYQAKKDESAYFRKRANTILQLSKKGGTIPKVNLGNQLFDRIFGGSSIEMKPQGNIEMFLGGNWQHIKNPTMVQSAQKYGIFDFDMNMNVNLLAKVGEKMRMNFNYNTKATFDFENQLKLEYTGQDDDIIKKIEAGYVSFPLKTSLIQGVRS